MAGDRLPARDAAPGRSRFLSRPNVYVTSLGLGSPLGLPVTAPLQATDAELLGLMAEHRIDAERALSAWAALYARNVEAIHSGIARTYGIDLQLQDRENIVQDTFGKAFQWAVRQPDPSELVSKYSGSSREEAHDNVLGWLFVIAKRCVMDHFSDMKTSTEELMEYLENYKRESVPAPPTTPTRELAALQEVLSNFSETDMAILRLSLPWYSVEKGIFATPSWEAFKIAQRLGISVELLRKRRTRLLARIRQHLGNDGLPASGESS